MSDRASELRAIADGRLMLNVRNGVTVARSMLAMIADEIDALRSAPLAPAEVGGLVERLQERATVMETLSPDFASACREAASLIQSLTARIAELEAAIRGLLDCPDIADNDFKDEETHAAERAARALLNKEGRG